MRKLLFIAAGILAIGLVSCEKQGGIPNNDKDLAVGAVKAVYEIGETYGPQSANEVDPVIIPGENKGGNRTCEEVWAWFGDGDEECGVDYACGDKVDYEDFDSHLLPGLNVEMDGIYVSFNLHGECLILDGYEGFWKVGAVIVKGSNAANVYWYPDGTFADSHLAAPGDKHMVSNLTFCFVPCEPEEEPELVIAFKTSLEKMVNDAKVNSYAYTVGDYLIPNVTQTTIPVGYHWLGFGEDFSVVIKASDGGGNIGTITATEVDDGGVPSILVEVVITSGDWDVILPYLYIGSEDGIDGLWYQNFPFNETDATFTADGAEFMIPISEITL